MTQQIAEYIQMRGERVEYDGSAYDLYAKLVDVLDAQPGDECAISKDGWVDTFLIHSFDGSIIAVPKYDISARFPIRLTGAG